MQMHFFIWHNNDHAIVSQNNQFNTKSYKDIKLQKEN